MLFPELESLPTSWGRFPEAGKFADAVGTFSRGWKACRRRGDVFPELESLPTSWGRFPEAGKFADVVGTFSRFVIGAFPPDEKETRTDAGAPVGNIGFLRVSVRAGLV